MARHRDYRVINRDEHELSDDDYAYGHSYDDHDQFGVSPTTSAMYTYRSEGRQIFADHLPKTEYSIDEREFELQNEDFSAPPPPELAAASKPSPKPPDVLPGRSTSAAITIGGRSAVSDDRFAPKPQRQPRKNRRSKAQEEQKQVGAIPSLASCKTDDQLDFKMEHLNLAETPAPLRSSPCFDRRPRELALNTGRRQSSPVLRTLAAGDASGAKSGQSARGRVSHLAGEAPPTPGNRTPTSKPNSGGNARTPAGVTPADLEKKSKALSARVQEAYQLRQANTKPAINLVVVGHVDAGKSTLMGHVLHIIEPSCETRNTRTGPVDEERAVPYAWNLDETDAERCRGVTIDVAQTCFETTNRRVVLLDAPGHKDYIPNMISGAAQADVVLLVVNATRGEFETGFEWGGQTREHAMLVRSFGVLQIVVAVNKMDTVDWSRERYEHIVKHSRSFLKQTLRFTSITYVPVSGLLGCNLTERPDPKQAPQLTAWYDGPCLMECIDKLEPPARSIEKSFRFCVADVFRIPNSPGITVAGIVVAGGAFVGTKVLCRPAGQMATVKSISVTSLSDRAVDGAFAGDCCTMVLSGVDIAVMSTGDVLCDPAFPVPCSSLLHARILLLTKDVSIQRGASVMFHHQNLSETAIVARFLGLVDRAKGEPIASARPPRVLNKGCCADVEIRLEKSICLELYKDFRELGRFTLRHAGQSVASGTVMKLFLDGGVVLG